MFPSKITIPLCLILFTGACASKDIVPHNFDTPLPVNLKQALDEHHTELDRKPDVKIPEWLDDWVVKTGGQRLQGTKQAAQTINTHNLAPLSVPETYEYQAPDGKTYTISLFHKEGKEPITLAETRQIWRFAKRANWGDLHVGNFIKTDRNVIMLVDTKDTFIQNPAFAQLPSDHKKYLMITKLVLYLPNFTPEAETFLRQKHDKYTGLHEQNSTVVQQVQQRRARKTWWYAIKRAFSLSN